MAEMITGYPLFRGRDNADQLVQIMKIVGTPSNETLAQIKHDSVYSFTSLMWRSTDK
jgi:negative regulator of PHO system